MMKQNKKQKKYLTPKVNVVSFVVEGGFVTSPIETAKPAASTYQDVDNSYNDWGTVTNGSTL